MTTATNSIALAAEEWPTKFRFHHPCGCGMNIDAETFGEAMAVLTADYMTHAGHSRQGPRLTGRLLKYPGLQVATVDINYITGSVEWTLGGPLFPCGDGWDYTCARCGEAFHTELPDEHTNPPGDCAGHIHVCDACGAKMLS